MKKMKRFKWILIIVGSGQEILVKNINVAFKI